MITNESSMRWNYLRNPLLEGAVFLLSLLCWEEEVDAGLPSLSLITVRTIYVAHSISSCETDELTSRFDKHENLFGIGAFGELPVFFFRGTSRSSCICIYLR